MFPRISFRGPATKIRAHLSPSDSLLTITFREPPEYLKVLQDLSRFFKVSSESFKVLPRFSRYFTVSQGTSESQSTIESKYVRVSQNPKKKMQGVCVCFNITPIGVDFMSRGGNPKWRESQCTCFGNWCIDDMISQRQAWGQKVCATCTRQTAIGSNESSTTPHLQPTVLVLNTTPTG